MVYSRATKKGLLPKNQVTASQKPGMQSFDLSQINMVQLAHDLSIQINKPQPKGWLSKWWTNMKLPADNRRLELLNEYVEKIRTINSNVTEMQAELYAQPQVLQYIIEGKRVEAKLAVEKQIKEHEDHIHKLNNDMLTREATLREAEAIADKARADAHLTELQGALLKKIIDEMDINSITAAQAFILVKALNPEASAEVDFAAKELMIEQEIQKMKIENQMLESKAGLEAERLEDVKRKFRRIR